MNTIFHARRWAAIALIASASLLLDGTPAKAGNPEKGRAIAEQHCSRCHVIAKHNPFGGIGSTASFQMIAKMPDYRERFETFYARRPHPAFLRIPGIPRWSKQPGYAVEFKLTLEQVKDIAAFAETLVTMPIKRKRKK
ncbi:MAG: cytochrome c [Rhodospirillales bacterium]|nr:cytochrome c [Alphaproteobacteria bacterium]MBL6948203.1 cytochrome c [Rhodospirillales bacterium]